MGILNHEKPDLVHFQNDLEIFHASQLRDAILDTGTKLFMPTHDVIERCVFKYKSYEAFKAAGVIVPKNHMISTQDELKAAFSDLGDEDGKIWLRSSSIGGGGKGAVGTASFDLAKAWIDHYDGWGEFTAAEMLTPRTVTWLSIWHEGKLVVAQGRSRAGWIHGSRSISGVTGVTKVGTTTNDQIVTDVALASIKAVDDTPHGIYGVDMAYDKKGIPNPTEINISRFFTTILFFTEAGLNMPEIFKDLALYGKRPATNPIINPLPNGLRWARGMDTTPRLVTDEIIDAELQTT